MSMICPNCGEDGPHFVPPCCGEPGFFSCKPKGECKTCNDKKMIENSTSGIHMGGPTMVPCPTCVMVKESELNEGTSAIIDEKGTVIRKEIEK